MIETQFNCTVKIFQLDNAQEYNDKYFLSFLDSNGTLPHRFCPYTFQQNGHADENIVTFLMLSAPFSFLPLFLSAFRVRQHSLLFTPLIVFLHRVFSSFLCPFPQSLPFLLIFSSLSILNLWRILQHRLPLQTTHLQIGRAHV